MEVLVSGLNMELSDRVLFLAIILFGSTSSVLLLSTGSQVQPAHITGMIGEACKRDKNCLTEQMICINNVCHCLTGHYSSTNKRNCIATVGAECYESTDCLSLHNSVCDPEKKCACNERFLPSADNRQCLFNDTCRNEKDCPHGEWICKNKKCICKPGYVREHDKCLKIKGLGEACRTNSDCYFNTTECANNICECNDSFVRAENNDTCLIKAEYDEECKENVQCMMPNTVCDKKCMCQKGYEWKDSHCRKFKGIGDPCMDSNECYYNITSCINNICDCNELFVRARNKKNTCLEKAEYNMYCQEDHQCMKNNTVCERMRCICKKGYKWNKSDCIKNRAQLRTNFVWFIISLTMVPSRFI